MDRSPPTVALHGIFHDLQKQTYSYLPYVRKNRPVTVEFLRDVRTQLSVVEVLLKQLEPDDKTPPGETTDRTQPKMFSADELLDYYNRLRSCEVTFLERSKAGWGVSVATQHDILRLGAIELMLSRLGILDTAMEKYASPLPDKKTLEEDTCSTQEANGSATADPEEPTTVSVTVQQLRDRAETFKDKARKGLNGIIDSGIDSRKRFEFDQEANAAVREAGILLRLADRLEQGRFETYGPFDH